LEQAGVLQNIVSIAMMLMEHERSREIIKYMEYSVKKYIDLRNSTNLINYMQ